MIDPDQELERIYHPENFQPDIPDEEGSEE